MKLHSKPVPKMMNKKSNKKPKGKNTTGGPAFKSKQKQTNVKDKKKMKNGNEGKKKRKPKDVEEEESELNFFDEESDLESEEESTLIRKKKPPTNEDESDGSDDEEVIGKHKKQLAGLKNADPEFYKFLQENDKKLLQFDVSEEEDDNDGSDVEGSIDGKIHTLPDKLEGPSDESDIEDEEETVVASEVGKQVTLKMVAKWEEDLKTDKTSATIQNVIEAFHAALVSISSEEEKEICKFTVNGSAVFNSVLQLCVFNLYPALKKFLKLPSGSHAQPMKCKKWIKVRTVMKSYIGDLFELLNGVTSDNVICLLLKHLHQLTPFVTCYNKTSRLILKRLVGLWSSGEETVRVLSFLCLLKISNHYRPILETTLKMMYMSYVRNTKFVSPSTLAGINFMRKSLVEMFRLDENVSYQHAFLYIRQLAINLRNAVTLKKKESFQAVYNWQFVNCLRLWGELLGVCQDRYQLHSLLYPLVQITIGTIKLVPTVQYFPLRFHCLSVLINICRNSGSYIPVLPFLLEILNSFDFNKKHKAVSMKPHDLTFTIRASKSQMQENGYKDIIIEDVNRLLLEYLSTESHKVAFPDLVVTSIQQLKQFLKTCKITNYCKKMKVLLEKVEENSKYIEMERRKVTVQLQDIKAVQALETQIKLRGTPLSKYYDNWKKVYVQQQAKKLSMNDELADYKLPELKKRKREDIKEEDDGPVELFPSDDEEEDTILEKNNEINEVKEAGPPKKKSKNKSTRQKVREMEESDEDIADEVEDFNLSDVD